MSGASRLFRLTLVICTEQYKIMTSCASFSESEKNGCGRCGGKVPSEEGQTLGKGSNPLIMRGVVFVYLGSVAFH